MTGDVKNMIVLTSKQVQTQDLPLLSLQKEDLKSYSENSVN